ELDLRAGRTRRGQQGQRADRELALGQDRQHGLADRAGGANDGYVETTGFIAHGVHSKKGRWGTHVEPGSGNLRQTAVEAPYRFLIMVLPEAATRAVPASSRSVLTTLAGRPASGPMPSPASRLSTASCTIARRVASEALPICGVNTILRSASSSGRTCGSFS